MPERNRRDLRGRLNYGKGTGADAAGNRTGAAGYDIGFDGYGVDRDDYEIAEEPGRGDKDKDKDRERKQGAARGPAGSAARTPYYRE